MPYHNYLVVTDPSRETCCPSIHPEKRKPPIQAKQVARWDEEKLLSLAELDEAANELFPGVPPEKIVVNPRLTTIKDKVGRCTLHHVDMDMWQWIDTNSDWL